MSYVNKFFDTCFGDQESTRLQHLVGAALYHDEDILGKIIVLVGRPGTGKTSFLGYLFDFARYDRQITIYDDIDIDRAISSGYYDYDFEPDLKKVWFVATNREPQTDSDRIIKIHTTGERMPLEDWKKYCIEMDYFHSDFFKQCMGVYTFRQQISETIHGRTE